jgi:hypothetical protein
MNPGFTRAVFCVIALSMPFAADAYIDPNAGGMLFQLLAPVFAAAVGAWLFVRRQIKALLRAGWLWLMKRLGR